MKRTMSARVEHGVIVQLDDVSVEVWRLRLPALLREWEDSEDSLVCVSISDLAVPDSYFVVDTLVSPLAGPDWFPMLGMAAVGSLWQDVLAELDRASR